MNQNNEWYTPQHILARVRATMGHIDLDVASCDIAQRFVKADIYYTQENSALLKSWHGRVWMNPPYSNALIKRFTKRLNEQYQHGKVTEFICLTNSGTDTLWNKPLQSHTQIYTNGRIRFIQPNGTMKAAGSRGQCFTYAGPNKELFLHTFLKDGFCWAPNIDNNLYNMQKLKHNRLSDFI